MMTIEKLISRMMVLTIKSNRIKTKINLARVEMLSVAVNRGLTITMVVEEVQVIVIIVINTIKEVVKVMVRDSHSEVEDVVIMEAEVEATAIVAVMTSKYLMILNTDLISIDVRMTMNQVILKTKVSVSIRSIIEVAEVVDQEELLATEEDIKARNLEEAKVDMVITSNIVDHIIKEGVEVERVDQALRTTRWLDKEHRPRVKVKSKVKVRVVALSSAPKPQKTVKMRECIIQTILQKFVNEQMI